MIKLSTSPAGIGGKIGRLVALSVLSACLIITVILTLLQFNHTLATKRDELHGTAAVFSTTIGKPVSNNDVQSAQSILTSVARIPGLVSATVLGKDGNPISAMGSAVLLGRNTTSEADTIFGVIARGTMTVKSDIVYGGETVGTLVIVSDVSHLRNESMLIVLVAFAAACTAAAASLLLSRPLQQRIVQPIIQLTSAIQQISQSKNYASDVNHSSDDETGELVNSFNSLIADIRGRDAALQKVAFYDALTGLPNRASFQQNFETKHQADCAVYLLDLDGFRETNDALGHSIGDALLMDVAALLHTEARDRAEVYRIGGDEFVIVEHGITEETSAQQSLARFISLFYQPIRLLAHEVHVSLSAGVSLKPRDGTNASDLLRHCNLAVQNAKKAGLGRVEFFRPQMDEKIQFATELVIGLRNSLRNGEFKVHYQPQVALRDGAGVTGFEALLRWSHPSKGNISPALFIPVAEDAGLLPELGRLVLRESCKQATEWFKSGAGPYQVSVNVSAAQLMQAEFTRDVEDALTSTGLPPPLLCLELTESVFLGRTVSTVRHMFNDLKAMGIELALDDFGTGYSSLSYLEGLPFDKVKIDRAFVNGVQNNDKKMSLLKSIIYLSHALKMKVVAEGAETAADIAALRALGADEVQGFFYSKPAPSAEALKIALEINRRAVKAG
jgi:diguanylate cyclase (GGDEF)-like protein